MILLKIEIGLVLLNKKKNIVELFNFKRDKNLIIIFLLHEKSKFFNYLGNS